MKEIKFRAWDRSRKKMIYGIEAAYDGCGNQIRLADIDYEDYFGSYIGVDTVYRSANGKNYEVMQFIGLRDKNGREIFERDIIKPPHLYKEHGPGEIVYLAPGYAYRPKDVRYGFSLSQFDYRYPGEEYEVIGNTFENPELL